MLKLRCVYIGFDLCQMISDLNTFLNKAVPDTRLTIKKYLDAKFEYLVSIQDFSAF
jgi:Arfaptin-like domain